MRFVPGTWVWEYDGYFGSVKADTRDKAKYKAAKWWKEKRGILVADFLRYARVRPCREYEIAREYLIGEGE